MKFSEGDKIVVSHSSREYQKKHIGKTGVIEKSFRTRDRVIMYGVRLENLHNLSSSKGLFWFRTESLSSHIPNETTINESEETNMPFHLSEKFIAVRIRFLDSDSKEPHKHLYALFDPAICPGDTVVVSTGHHGYTLAEIISGSEDPADLKSVACGREVVCRADFTAYNHRKEIRTRVAEVQKQMDAKVRELQKVSIYQMFAEVDPAMEALFNEFKTLTGISLSEKTASE